MSKYKKPNLSQVSFWWSEKILYKLQINNFILATVVSTLDYLFHSKDKLICECVVSVMIKHEARMI